MSTYCNLSLNLLVRDENKSDLRIDSGQTRINCATVLSKFQDETRLTFVDYPIKIVYGWLMPR